MNFELCKTTKTQVFSWTSPSRTTSKDLKFNFQLRLTQAYKLTISYSLRRKKSVVSYGNIQTAAMSALH